MPEKVSIVKSNDLIETSYNLGKRELLWILMQLAEVNSNPDNGDEELPVFSMSGKEIMDSINFDGVRRVADTAEIFEIMKNLNSKVIQWETPRYINQVAWISYMRYDKDLDLYEWSIPKELKPLLLQLKENFTLYTLDNIIRLKNAHAINFYEILKRYQFQKTVEVTLDKLKFWLGIEGKYPVWRDFKKRILDPCKNQINTFTDVYFIYEVIKKGKKIIGLKIIIKKNPKYVKTLQREEKVELPFPAQPKTKEEKELRQKLKSFALSEANIRMLMKSYTKEKVWEAVNYTEGVGTVRNKAGYVLKYLEESWTSPETGKKEKKEKEKEGIAKKKEIIAKLEKQIEDVHKEMSEDKTPKYQLLCSNKASLQKAYDTISSGIFSPFVKNKTLEESLADSMTRGAILGELERMHPEIFEEINNTYSQKIHNLKQQLRYYETQPYQFFLREK